MRAVRWLTVVIASGLFAAAAGFTIGHVVTDDEHPPTTAYRFVLADVARDGGSMRVEFQAPGSCDDPLDHLLVDHDDDEIEVSVWWRVSEGRRACPAACNGRVYALSIALREAYEGQEIAQRPGSTMPCGEAMGEPMSTPGTPGTLMAPVIEVVYR